MLIGKPGLARTSLCTAQPDAIEVRGRDLCGDLMGRLTFTEFFFFSVTGREPSAEQRDFLDLLLIAIAEHGLTPTAQVARMIHAAAPDALQGALAAGLLGCGSVVLGTAELCAALLAETRGRVDAGVDPDTAVDQAVRKIHAEGGKVPGFGHPLHRPLDPRTERILELAESRGVAATHVDLARRFPAAVERAWGKPLPMNVSMAIAAVLLDLDFPPAMAKAVPLLARTAGLLAHLAEEQQQPIGFYMASKAEEAIRYERVDREEGE